MEILRKIIQRNRAGEAIAVTSVCSSHHDVLLACLHLAAQARKLMLIEATSNQVNQFGGYTGMKPHDFVAYVYKFCDQLKLDRAQIYFGGDHLGPQVWREGEADIAMGHAKNLVESYVKAGFSKIHLDCSEGCKGEAAQVGDDLAGERASELAHICEQATPDASSLSYIIGTEVPPPGGARGDHDPLAVTQASAAITTIERHKQAFERKGLMGAFKRVVGLVVQPGVEFGADHIDRFDINALQDLPSALADYPTLAFEAHSTDYQFDHVFKALAQHHFAILKVGPALTFAYRRALYALDFLVNFLSDRPKDHSLPALMEQLMDEKPGYWRDHYGGGEKKHKELLHFGYADRIRYYWNHPQAIEAVQRLEKNFDAYDPGAHVLCQFFSDPILSRAENLRSLGIAPAKSLIWAQIQTVLDPYLENLCPLQGNKIQGIIGG